MSYEFARYEKRGHLAYVTINRPEVMNALHPPAHAELAAIWDDFAADEDLWVAILTGAGERAFCAGDDIKYAAEHPGLTYWEFNAGPHGFGGLSNRTDLFKPIIAAVNGFALAAGMVVAISCDLIIAAEHAEFGMPEPRIGFYSGFGGIERLMRVVPEKLAMEIILLGHRISAQDGYRMGFVNAVVPGAELMATTEAWAEEIVACSPMATRANKQAALRALDVPLEAASNRIYDQAIRLWQSQDYAEGPRSFVEKRAPRWEGR